MVLLRVRRASQPAAAVVALAVPIALAMVLAALSSTTVTAQSISPCAPGMDHPNDDLPGMPLPMPTSLSADYGAACGSLCGANPLCNMYVVVSAGCDGATAPLCFLKSGPPSASPSYPCKCFGAVNHTSDPGTPGAPLYTLANADGVNAALGASGLLSLAVGSVAVVVEADTWVVAVDGQVFNSTGLPTPTSAQDPATGTYPPPTLPCGCVGLGYVAKDTCFSALIPSWCIAEAQRAPGLG